ncbi:PASTA domain-containing protein [Bacteroidales bacterium]|nr:PASTA domain-containing protein [Bacteroidales bacterium]
MELLKYIFSKAFLKNLLIALGIVLFIGVGTQVGLKIYSQHGESFTVPDLKGLSLSDTEGKLLELNLRYEISDSIFLLNKEKGSIVEQFPKPGAKVKQNRIVYLTTNAWRPKLVVMPKVTHVSIRQATGILSRYGLTVGKLNYVSHPSKNYVLKQFYKDEPILPGDSVYMNAEIDLELGNGLSDEKTIVPNLVGLSLGDAEKVILDAYLNLGTPIFDSPDIDVNDTIPVLVYKQNPDVDKEDGVPLGSYIDVWLTTDSLKVFPDSTEIMELIE